MKAGKLILSRVFYKTLRYARILADPLWRVQIRGIQLRRYLDEVFYSSPLAPKSAQLRWGHTLYFPKRYHGRIQYVLGDYEPEITRYLMSTVREGMHVVDVGAHIGYYTLLLSHLVGRSGTVYAFEPEPHFYEALIRNITANRLSNVQAYPYAVSERSGKVAFYADSKTGCSSLIHNPTTFAATIQVPAIALDEAIPEGTSIALIKMDVEGAELMCLRGMSRILRSNPNLIVVLEMNLPALERQQISPETYLRELEQFGLRNISVFEYGMQPLTPSELPILLERMHKDRLGHINLLARAG